MSEKLKACPFTHAAKEIKHELGIYSEEPAGFFYVTCACGALGPCASSPEKATELWNRRTLPPEVEAVMEAALDSIVCHSNLVRCNCDLCDAIEAAIDSGAWYPSNKRNSLQS